nr:photosystem I subunit IX [Helleborus atrorubens]
MSRPLISISFLPLLIHPDPEFIFSLRMNPL